MLQTSANNLLLLFFLSENSEAICPLVVQFYRNHMFYNEKNIKTIRHAFLFKKCTDTCTKIA